MAEDPDLGEVGRALARHEMDIRDIREKYVLREVFLAAVERIARLEQADAGERSGNRQWLLGLVQTIAGVVLGIVGGYLTARGGK